MSTLSNYLLGLLAVGSQSGLSIFTLILENDLLTWNKKWSARWGSLVFLDVSLNRYGHSVATPSSVKFAPTLAYIATITAVRPHVVGFDEY